jgi:O-acetyl-ADP-ribose deacetylase (regulator of RNase III)
MIRYVTGDLLKSSAQVLVNPVNVVGVMGKGLVQQFKDQYPQMFKEYEQICKAGDLRIGLLWMYKNADKWILNFPTKKHYKDASKPEYVEAGLKNFVDSYESLSVTSIAFPQLGCGLGGLNWESQVKPLMEQHLADLPIDISIYVGEEKRM